MILSEVFRIVESYQTVSLQNTWKTHTKKILKFICIWNIHIFIHMCIYHCLCQSINQSIINLCRLMGTDCPVEHMGKEKILKEAREEKDHWQKNGN